LAAAETEVDLHSLLQGGSKENSLPKLQPTPKLQEEGYGPVKVKSPGGFQEKIEGASTGDASNIKVEAAKNLGDHSSYNFSDLLYRETHVLGGVKEIMQGIKARASEAVHDWPLTAIEIASGVVIGSGLVLASRNPALATSMKILNRTMLAIAGVDLTSRIAIPSYDALVHPAHLEADRHDLGNRLGAAVVDYGVAAVAGGVGSRAIAPLIERSPLGPMVSGYDFFKMPSGAEIRVFKSGNSLITKNGVRAFRISDMDFDQLDPTAAPKGIMGNNDLLRQTFADAENHPNKWREGKDITESAGKFGTWFESLTGALASEVVERTVDVGIGLLEHDYLVKTLEGPDSKVDHPVPDEKAKDK
jgi:hypothetical protein